MRLFPLCKFLPLSLILTLIFAFASSRAVAQWPSVESVDRQPLLAQVSRIREALGHLGAPLSELLVQQLEQAVRSPDDAMLTSHIQQILDPLCLAAVSLDGEDQTPVVFPQPNPLELEEQGWRAYLVKVINPMESRARLRIDSPSAQPLAHSPADEVASRWLSLSMFDGQPLTPALTGLPLEYRIVEVYSREPGERTARLEFALQVSDRADGKLAWGSAEWSFQTRQSFPVTFHITDAPDRPAFGCFEITDPLGRVYPPQSKRLAPDFFFQRQIYRGDGESIQLPSGTYTIRCSRGPETVPEVKTLVVDGGPADLHYKVQRWIDPSRRGYWSGDHHIHAAGCAHYENPTQGVHPPDMLRHCMGEDLKVGCCLTWGPCFDFQKRFFTGKLDDHSRYPYLIRYDVEVSGFGSHVSGHLNLLRLKQQIPPGGESKEHWPTLGLNTLRWAKKQGALCGPAHSANGLTRFVDRVPGTDGMDGPGGLPTFNIPAFDGIGANEFIMNVAHTVEGPEGKQVPAVDFISTMDTDRTAELNMWYHVLNCGFRVRASGETDFPCISGERVGLGRVYARLDGPLDFDRWCDAVAAGRSYVSDGRTHLMDFSAEGPEDRAIEIGTQESIFRIEEPQKLVFMVRAASFSEPARTVQVELVVNGFPVASQEMLADGQGQEIRFEQTIEKSSWAAIRVFPSCHTNPVFIHVGGAPIRGNRWSALWCLQSLEQCWKMKAETYQDSERETAQRDYAHAREVFQSILAEHLDQPPATEE